MEKDQCHRDFNNCPNCLDEWEMNRKNAKYLEKSEIFLIFAHKNTLMNN